jgi:hypothetical protein
MRISKKVWMPGLFAVIALVLVACGSDPTATEESDYLKEVARAERTTAAIFQAFGSVISQVYPMRETRIAALLESGIGTPFIEKTAILESLDPPAVFREGHQVWLEASQELLRIDTEAAGAVRDGDSVRFALLNGQLDRINTAAILAISPVFCNAALTPQPSPVCTSEDPGFDGEYLIGINDVARDFLPAFAAYRGNFASRLSLTPEELSQVMAETSKDSREAFQGFYSFLESVVTPDDIRADHERLREFFWKIVQTITEVERLDGLGDDDAARGEFLKISPAFCDTKASFESEEFKAAVAIIFIGGANTCGGAPF